MQKYSTTTRNYDRKGDRKYDKNDDGNDEYQIMVSHLKPSNDNSLDFHSKFPSFSRFK